MDLFEVTSVAIWRGGGFGWGGRGLDGLFVGVGDDVGFFEAVETMEGGQGTDLPFKRVGLVYAVTCLDAYAKSRKIEIQLNLFVVKVGLVFFIFYAFSV